MPAFRVTGGVLRGALVSDASIDNTLPGVEGPVDPGYGISSDRPSHGLPPFPDNSLPPPGVWPPPVPSHPIVIAPPGTPPGVIWPSPGRPDHTLPMPPVYPSQGLPGDQPGIDNSLPGSQPRPDNTLPTGPLYPSHPIASQTYWMIAYCPQLGWKYVSVDPSLRPDQGLPSPQPVPTPHG